VKNIHIEQGNACIISKKDDRKLLTSSIFCIYTVIFARKNIQIVWCFSKKQILFYMWISSICTIFMNKPFWGKTIMICFLVHAWVSCELDVVPSPKHSLKKVAWSNHKFKGNDVGNCRCVMRESTAKSHRFVSRDDYVVWHNGNTVRIFDQITPIIFFFSNIKLCGSRIEFWTGFYLFCFCLNLTVGWFCCWIFLQKIIGLEKIGKKIFI